MQASFAPIREMRFTRGKLGPLLLGTAVGRCPLRLSLLPTLQLSVTNASFATDAFLYPRSNNWVPRQVAQASSPHTLRTRTYARATEESLLLGKALLLACQGVPVPVVAKPRRAAIGDSPTVRIK